MTASAQIIFEVEHTGETALAIFNRFPASIGAGAETFGLGIANFFAGLIQPLAGRAVCWHLQYCQAGVIVFLPVSQRNVDRALSAIWGALSRFDIEDTSLVAQLQRDGTWQTLFPKRGEPFVLPAEIQLPSRQALQIESEITQLDERLAQLKSNLRLGALTQPDFDASAAWIRERAEAIQAAQASQRAQLCGGQS